jgi:hypothetical protein
MTNNKSDLIIAIFLLCFSGIMINDASNIRDLGFEGMKADAWPRVVLWMLVVMSSIMLGKTYLQFKTDNHKDNNIFKINFSKFKNALLCFGMFIFFSINIRLPWNAFRWDFVCFRFINFVRWFYY